MHQPPFPPLSASQSKPLSREDQATALITVLALITILTIVLLTYFNVVKMDRLATRNYAQGIRAEQVARGSIDFIIGQLRSEMADGTTPLSVGNYTIFTNITSKNIRPQASGTDAAVPALVKMSTAGHGLYSSTTTAVAAVAVSSTSSNTSANGRRVTTSRWGKPGFGTPTTAPSWFLIGSGTTGITTTPSRDVQGRFAFAVYDEGSLIDINVAGYPSSLNAAQISAIKGSLAGLGISTLPGFSSTAADALIQGFRNRSSATSGSNYVSQVLLSATNGFLRVAAGDDTFLSRQDLLTYANLNGLNSAIANLTSFSRTVNAPSWSPSLNAGTFTLQTITRTSVGAPFGAAPNLSAINNFAVIGNISVDYNYQSNALNGSSKNRSFLSQPVTGAFTRFDGSLAVVGEPLVLARFPLSRLSWLSKDGISASAISKFGSAAAAAAKVKAAFGLVWDTTNRLWVYTSPSAANGGGNYSGSASSNGPASSGKATGTIKTLATVASENREPDFFELLQAGILCGSLGQRSSINSASYTLQPGEITPEGHIFQIGVNIIDQYGTGDYPTLIRTYMPVVMRCVDPNTLPYVLGSGSNAMTPYDFAGVKNLPYLEGFRLRPFRQEIAQGNVIGRPNAQGIIIPQFWNPHQNADTPSSDRPSTLRLIQTFGSFRLGFEPYPIAGTTVYTSPSSEWPSSTTPPQPQPSIEFKGGLTFSVPGFLKPGDVTATSIPQMIRPALTGDINSAGFVGFWLGQANAAWDEDVWNNNGGTGPCPLHQYIPKVDNSVTKNSVNLPSSDPFWKGDTVSAAAYSSRLPVFELQYLDGTVWKTYQRIDGAMAVMQKAIYPNYAKIGKVPAVAGGNSISFTDEFLFGFFARVDPRGSRFGLMNVNMTSSVPGTPGSFYSMPLLNASTSMGWGTGEATPYVAGGNPDPGNQSGSQFSAEFVPASQDTLFPNWQIIDNVASGQYYTDTDNQLRRGDANSAAGVNPLSSSTTSRPVMLNRAFTSVGDLGYVFRDLPFKTLNLFSANSADSGLLDIFCINELPGVVAGITSLNSQNSTVVAQLLNSAVKVETTGVKLSSTESTSIAASLVNTTGTNAFTGLSDLPAFLSGTAYGGSVTGDLKNIKPQMEVVPRQLANISDARCWNLMIDVVAQSGRYSSGVTNPDLFIVEGERRYWLHLAIDRVTGKVIARQLEPVFEQ